MDFLQSLDPTGFLSGSSPAPGAQGPSQPSGASRAMSSAMNTASSSLATATNYFSAKMKSMSTTVMALSVFAAAVSVAFVVLLIVLLHEGTDIHVEADAGAARGLIVWEDDVAQAVFERAVLGLRVCLEIAGVLRPSGGMCGGDEGC